MERLVRLGVPDAGEVLTLQRAAYVTEAQLHDDLDLPPLRQTLDEVTAELANADVLALGWRDDDTGRLLAAVRVRIDRDPESGVARAEIGRLSVVPDGQGRGLGSRLMHAVEQELPPEVSELRLFTGEHSRRNIELYVRLGYVETHRLRIPAGYDLVHLGKQR